MTSEASGGRQIPAFNNGILDQLGCPVCFETLRFEENSVVCAGCGRVYPVIDGIPVLIAERSTHSRADALD